MGAGPGGESKPAALFDVGVFGNDFDDTDEALFKTEEGATRGAGGRSVGRGVRRHQRCEQGRIACLWPRVRRERLSFHLITLSLDVSKNFSKLSLPDDTEEGSESCGDRGEGVNLTMPITPTNGMGDDDGDDDGSLLG